MVSLQSGLEPSSHKTILSHMILNDVIAFRGAKIKITLRAAVIKELVRWYAKVVKNMIIELRFKCDDF